MPHRPNPDPSARSRGPIRADPLSRRAFLQRSAVLGIGAPTLASLLEACSCKASPSSAGASLTLAAPDHPVAWPIAADNKPIVDGLTPEKGATLKLYNYADYIDPAAIKSFEKKYAAFGVKVTVSTFNDSDEALTKIRAGASYDLYVPSYDAISKLVTAKLIRPLNHSYITGIDNVWQAFQNPWYDREWRYTIPYTVYTTGIGWRTDQVPEDVGARANPYDALWDPKYKGKTAIIDDWHTAMAMVLLRNGITDINTSSPKDLKLIASQLSAISSATRPKVTITMYNDLPAGQFGLCQMWSGDAVNAVSYLPKGTSSDVLRYWYPPDGKGEVDNDLMVILRGGKNPVLAHLFLNHMLDPTVAMGNFVAVGYQPPQRSINPAQLVRAGLIPATLGTTVVKESDFNVGYRLLELSPANDAAWHTVWQSFKAGA